jgi:hypothetical protein
MAYCTLCGRSLGWWNSLVGPGYHQECKQQAEIKQVVEARRAEAERIAQEGVRRQANEKARSDAIESLHRAAETGDFSSVSSAPEIILDPEEICHCTVGGCCRAAYIPQVIVTGSGGLTTPGFVDPNRMIPKDSGTLHLTSKRLCFSGTAGVVSLPLRKILQCRAFGKTLCVAVEGRVTASYFILDEEVSTAFVVAIQRLSSQVKAMPKPARAKRLDGDK